MWYDCYFHFVKSPALHELISDNLSSGLADHTPNTCIVCTPEAFSEIEVSMYVQFPLLVLSFAITSLHKLFSLFVNLAMVGHTSASYQVQKMF